MHASPHLSGYPIVLVGSGEIAADGGGVVVAYDYADNRKAALPQSIRTRIVDLERDQRSAGTG